MFLFIIIIKTISNKEMIEENRSEQQNQESNSSCLNGGNINQLEEEEILTKIKKFYQVLQRLKKFVEDTSSITFSQDDQLNRYILKFKKYDKNSFNPLLNVVKLAQERIQRMNKNQKIFKNWRLDDKRLLHCIILRLAKSKHFNNIQSQFTQQDWNQVASLIPGATPNSCMFKWLSFHKTNIYEANWSEQESQLLKNLVQKYTFSNKAIRWKDVCKKLYLFNQNDDKKYRTPKQCKQHWNFKQNSNFRREPWSQEEDILLFKTIKQNSGLKKWVQMVKLFKGRTQNAVKNRYNLIIQKQKKCLQIEKQQLQLVENYLQRCYVQKNSKIIQPDAQQQAKLIAKTEAKKLKKSKLSKKQEHSQQDKILGTSSLLSKKQNNNFTSQLIIIAQNQPQKNQSNRQFLDKEISLIKKYDITSMQNLSQNNRYDHRANDIQFDFMNLDS